jgi:hypothetical protein
MPKKQSLMRVPRDVYSRVRQMRPVALTVLEQGLDDGRVEFTDDIPYLEPSGSRSDAEIAELVKWTSVVYALGIAIGLLLHPDVFKTGGAR